ncbi:MAG TPA: flagellar basal body-associated FliL family protein [Hypericibacter adhaerens]|jgi:flagellar FliL protein|uniref:flagellar basal body-associated FliL family protein n=1 Tax=Hypericibacter adhaerens TaxID=2602016 RepID=UPI002CEEE0D1|nr:flagellar basal body-associated FliL family protein [Hypericibacter adhaerens]HWA43289.1 flagellar basal body-associated FliL family protein [Hypericibacter adhaerens]
MAKAPQPKGKTPEADEAQGDAAAAEAPKKKKFSGKKLVLFVLLPLLLLGGGGAGAYMMGLFGGAKAEQTAEAKPEETKPSIYYEMPEMLVNLVTTGKKPSYLKLKVSLELKDEEASKQVEAVLPRIVDSFQVYLRALRVEDLQGSAGILRLRQELLTRVADAAKPAEVHDVLFKEMLVQ